MDAGTIYLTLILVILTGSYLLTFFVEWLNMAHAAVELPKEFEGYYDAERYRTSQRYLKEHTRATLLFDGVFLAVTLVFILAGGFNSLDLFARRFGYGEIGTGLIFTFILAGASQLLSLPFSAYRTFVIEQKYGFNRTTLKTFILDHVKSWVITAIVGGAVFSAVLWLFMKRGAEAWLYSWAILVIFQLVFQFIAPVLIMPLFNKFVPLQEGELKEALENYARKEGFKLKGMYTMDGSKRSTKSNAFFTGFGRFRRIVLFDTLIAKHTVDELVSVLAHEMGHYKKKHILKFLMISIATTGVTLFLLSLFINNPGLFAAFKMERLSVYASFTFFGFLYAPLSMFLSVAANAISRKYEYESDAYAVRTYGKPDAMIVALKKLSVDNLSNLTPHPLKVFLEYSHPTVLRRIYAIRRLTQE